MRNLYSILFGAAICASATAQEETAPPSHPVIDWLRTKDDGYFNKKIVVQDGGMFATQDIFQGETLMVIPPSALLMGSADDDESESGLSCATAHRLVEEYTEKGEAKSEYWPYVQYVFESFPHETVPMGWSKEGKQLVRDIVGEELEPQGFGYGSFFDHCFYPMEERSDPRHHELLEAAYRIVMSRGWHHVMVPVLDMVNHRNGEWLNVDRDPNSEDLEVDGDYNIVALKDIPKGSQLHNSYNQCGDATCVGIEYTYITPQIFLDYGFVEQYPRRFAFDTGYQEEGNELGLLIEIDENDESETLELTWLTGGPYGEEIDWLEDEKQRLLDLDIGALAQNLKHSHEASAAKEFYEALLSAIDFAIQAAEEDDEEEEEDEF